MLIRKLDQHSGGKGIVWFEVVGHPMPIKAAGSQTGSSHIYEYGWTLGYQLKPAPKHLKAVAGRIERWAKPATPLFGLPGPSVVVSNAHVRIFFPTLGDWLIIPQAAAIKHLSPVEKEEQWRQRMAEDWNNLAPILGVAGQVGADVSGLAPIGDVAKAVAGIRATSVPQTPDANWFVRAVNIIYDNVLYRGVEWQLPRVLLDEVGTQISGSLLVSFTEVRTSTSGKTTAGLFDAARPILADVSLSDDDK